MGRRITDSHVRTLMSEYERTGVAKTAALRADMCRQTAGKYLKGGRLPSAMGSPRHWRTRADPLAGIWAEAEALLSAEPSLEAKAVFERLSLEHAGEVDEGWLRTFQRRVREWRARFGPDREVFFEQVHRPGRRMALDFTCMNRLGITVGGEPFAHLLCHCVLTYSNWSWATICFSESLAALRDGLHGALLRLGHVPEELWTDNSTAATHRPGGEGVRAFNSRYVSLTAQLGLTPKVTNVEEPHENGDVESQNGALKNRIEQALLLRGSREFADRGQYRLFLEQTLHRANDSRRVRLAEEMAVMRPLGASALTEFEEQRVTVSKWSTVRLERNTYSVPSRLIGEALTARIYLEHIDLFHGAELQERLPRLEGRRGVRIDYRHVIHSLVRKPGAFRDWRHRAQVFPCLVFRQAHDRLREALGERVADLEYLRILKLAADGLEADVTAVLGRLLADGAVPRARTVEEFLPGHAARPVPALAIPAPDLSAYDRLLGRG